jgi:hypothetical protein
MSLPHSGMHPPFIARFNPNGGRESEELRLQHWPEEFVHHRLVRALRSSDRFVNEPAGSINGLRVAPCDEEVTASLPISR